MQRVKQLLDHEPETIRELRYWCQRAVDVLTGFQPDDLVWYQMAVWRKAHRLAARFGATEASRLLTPPLVNNCFQAMATLLAEGPLQFVSRLAELIAWCDTRLQGDSRILEEPTGGTTDGPYAFGFFRWKHKNADGIPSDQWKLLSQFFEGATPIDGVIGTDKLIDAVYGEGTDDKEDALNSLRRRLNDTLGAKDIRAEIERPRKAGGYRFRSFE
jgi:hypothetical protein